MKRIIIVTIILLLVNNAFSQFSDPNYKKKFTGSELVSLVEKIKFIPVNSMKGKGKAMKTYLLTADDEAYEMKQGNDDAWYLGFKKNSKFFKIWNMYYAKIEKPFWDTNCIGLIFLILLDNPSLAPKN